ncbi:MAG TPA: DUF1998 domain-containing protein, partial [Planctomycetota bacterium]|nr:DUF1998 domain-containing protein [Planctomycetota bacterium]
NVGAGPIQLPPEELDTESFLITLSEGTATALGLDQGDRGSAWRALADLLRRMAPLHIRCSASDLGISSHVRSPFFGRPTLFLFDRVQGGVGLSQLLVDAFPDLVRSALAVLERCECLEGCPACVGPRAQVGPEGKQTVVALLRHLIQGQDLNEVPVEGQVGSWEFEQGQEPMAPSDFGPEGHYARGVRSEEAAP